MARVRRVLSHTHRYCLIPRHSIEQMRDFWKKDLGTNGSFQLCRFGTAVGEVWKPEGTMWHRRWTLPSRCYCRWLPRSPGREYLEERNRMLGRCQGNWGLPLYDSGQWDEHTRTASVCRRQRCLVWGQLSFLNTSAHDVTPAAVGRVAVLKDTSDVLGQKIKICLHWTPRFSSSFFLLMVWAIVGAL